MKSAKTRSDAASRPAGSPALAVRARPGRVSAGGPGWRARLDERRVEEEPMADFEIRPKSVTLSGNQAQAFEAVRNGQPIAGVTWSLRPTAGSGTIDPVTGLYAAPRFVLLGRKVYVQATFRGVRLPAPGAAGC